MKTTIVSVDKELLHKAMEQYGFATKREAAEHALRRLVGYDTAEVLKLKGIGWEGDLDQMRGHQSGTD